MFNTLLRNDSKGKQDRILPVPRKIRNILARKKVIYIFTTTIKIFTD